MRKLDEAVLYWSFLCIVSTGDLERKSDDVRRLNRSPMTSQGVQLALSYRVRTAAGCSIKRMKIGVLLEI